MCLSCKERRRCKGTCQALKTKDEFTPGEWEHAAKPSSTSGRCTVCLRSGNWMCKSCKKKKPKMEFAMWTDAHPTSRPDRTTRCDSCMLLLQKQQQQEEEIRKSNMAQVVILSSKQVVKGSAGAKQAEMYPCAAPDCAEQHVQKHADAFDKWILQNFKDHKRTLICKVCSEKGYSVRAGGLQKHVCTMCGPGGHNMFDKNDLNNKRKRPTMKLRCLKCKMDN